MNSRAVSHTATQARLIVFFFCFFFVSFLKEYLCFRELHYRSQYIELLLKCLAAGKKLACINKHVIGELLFNGSFRQYFSIYHVVSKTEVIGREREGERERGKQLPASTANKVGPCPIATLLHPMTFFIIASIKL